MNPKALLFGVLGLLVSATLTMTWVGNDMERIRREERAKLKQECTSAMSSAQAPAPGTPTGTVPADPTAAMAATTGVPAVPPSSKLVKQCAAIGINLDQASSVSSTTPVDPGTGMQPLPTGDVSAAAAQGVPIDDATLLQDAAANAPQATAPAGDPNATTQPQETAPAQPAAAPAAEPAPAPAPAPATKPAATPAKPTQPAEKPATTPSDKPSSTAPEESEPAAGAEEPAEAAPPAAAA